MLASNLSKSRRALGPATFCVLALCCATAWADTSRLEVLDDHGKVLVALPMPEGERWCLEWNHSVTGIRVQDCYRHDQGKMMLERSHQPDFAAGLGHVPGRGRQVSDGQGGYWIEDIDEPVPGNRYRLRVGSDRVDHRLLHEGRRTSLSKRAAGERVTIHLRTPDFTP
ncbi:DUF1850 domain-containing protein [Halomonas sp. MCCC 1A11036]|uniref:DUF1850 domain-containing protein n=1 Tax=Billgrantia zhangzhouensis TaxID=2733481 RepID=A0ABS9AHV3_9GAMM|nr:DUF1850 domain-containing protein [Halomonas zhangzhouensis]MCE8021345.1 DUF1850 domain-containing protein [Halomonas zhangzhouensis]